MTHHAVVTLFKLVFSPPWLSLLLRALVLSCSSVNTLLISSSLSRVPISRTVSSWCLYIRLFLTVSTGRHCYIRFPFSFLTYSSIGVRAANQQYTCVRAVYYAQGAIALHSLTVKTAFLRAASETRG